MSFELKVEYRHNLAANESKHSSWLITIKATKPNKHGVKPVYWKVTKAKPTARQLRKCVKAFNMFNNPI